MSSTRLVNWSLQEFNRHLALLSSGDDEEGDAFQLAYNLVIQAAFNRRSLRPTTVSHALSLLAESQLPRGLWEKKEPLFVWERRGDAYCFSFELLNTLLFEFRNRYDELLPFDAALERSLEWAERNAHLDGTEGATWRSGHRTETKRPESWATAEVYAFLRRYEGYLDFRINSALLRKYRGIPATNANANALRRLYQPEVRRSVARQNHPLLNEVLERSLLEPLRSDQNVISLVRASEPSQLARSAILFGPPGTGKTSYVKAVAKYLGWPLLVLDPSDFASEGLHLVPTTISRIFGDLREARDVVIFFDEMEELMRDRRSESARSTEVTFEQRLLTTALLPKLQDLHDQARSLFFVATNHFAKIDEAARRFGRFDLTVEVLPACFEEKRRQIVDGVREGQEDPDRDEAVRFVTELTESLQPLSHADRTEEREKLEWATFGEVRTLVASILSAQGRGIKPEDAVAGALGAFEPTVNRDEWRDGFKFNKIPSGL